ncbi:MAG: hypothetical protein IPI29_08485 [Ignavibacteria bacterium]|nr:hypothetical protein [Ignavibacteria bacterium]
MPLPEINDIVQVNPQHPMFGGCLFVVTEVMERKILAYTQGFNQGGQAYLLIKHGDYEPTGGKAPWVVRNDDRGDDVPTTNTEVRKHAREGF